MNSIVLKYLEDEGYSNISMNYYNYINIWENWWRNNVKFHKYKDQFDNDRKLYTLGMAKRLSEDWSSALFTERDEIQTECKTQEQTKRNNEYLNMQLKILKIYKDLPTAIEKAMASGTAGSVLRVKYAKVDKNGNLSATERTRTDIIYLSASQIVPLKVEHGEIIDVAFVSEDTVAGEKQYYIEKHELKYDETMKKDIYWMTNTYLDKDGHEITKEDIVKSYTLHSDVPIFSILKPAIANPIDENYTVVNGLGFSVYGAAIDQLLSCDIAYNNFVMDFYLGGKKVFYNKKIVKEDEKGNPIYPDDVMKQQWLTYGDEITDIHDKPVITEYNPSLRVDENISGIEFALNVLSFKAGLGTGYYKFNKSTGTVMTATQYVGDRQDFISNANKHRKNVDAFVGGICKGTLLIGRVLFKEAVTEDCIVSVTDKDGFMVDTETAKQEFRQDIAQGIRQVWEYRVKFLGEDEETAKAMVAGENIENIDEE